MKKSIIIALIVFTSQLYAYQPTEGSTFVYTDILVWTLKEGGADNWAQEIAPVGTQRNARVLGVPFNWNAGLRIGAGYKNKQDCWDTVFSYTWFNTNGSSHANVSSGGIYSPFLGNFYINNTDGANFGPNYYQASVNWKFRFNILDLEFGRTFKIDQYFHLRPFVGLKGGVINQDINTNWHNPTTATTFTTATENLTNDFAGIGPSIGVNSTWRMYRTTKSSFNFIGNVSGALLWGHWHFNDIYANNTPTTVKIKVSNINGASPMARGLIGFEWASSIAGANLSVRLGYEAQIWFNQLQFYSLNMGRLNNLLSLQGGVLGLCLTL